MQQALPTDVRLRVENALLKITADLAADLPDDGAFFDLQAGPWRVVLSIGPTVADSLPVGPRDQEPLNHCEQRVVEALRAMVGDSDERKQGRVIYEWMRLNSRETKRRSWAWPSIAAALANLVAMRVLVNTRDKRGYGFAPPQKETAA